MYLVPVLFILYPYVLLSVGLVLCGINCNLFSASVLYFEAWRYLRSSSVLQFYHDTVYICLEILQVLILCFGSRFKHYDTLLQNPWSWFIYLLSSRLLHCLFCVQANGKLLFNIALLGRSNCCCRCRGRKKSQLQDEVPMSLGPKPLFANLSDWSIRASYCQ